MAQLLKPAVRGRIEASALAAFADRGFGAASMAAIAAEAGTAPANVYRYFPSKAALLAAVLPDAIIDRHDDLLAERLDALVARSPAVPASADALLDFWIEHRLAVAILLDRVEGTPHADYPARFVARLTASAEARAGLPLAPHHREVLTLVFDGTRRTVAHVLRTHADADAIRTRIHGFWSYQLPGLDGLVSWMAATG
jgi:AcrR family transcriptional regulator